MNDYYPFVNTPLPYVYDALEPYIDEKTMHLHHDKHLQTYIDNLNKIIKENPSLKRLSLEQMLQGRGRLPKNLQIPIRNNAGGVFNHRMYFDTLTNEPQIAPSGRFAEAIDKYFGDFDKFKEEMKASAVSVFGSGYAWLVSDHGRLLIITTPNQNTPLEMGYCPILNIDVWEHAYYLKHYNLRAAYIDDWFNVINWSKVEENYLNCMTR